jgi:two-component system response regulator HydG
MTALRPTLKDLVEAYEREIIQEALRVTRGNQRQAARALGVLPTTLHEKMKRLGLLQRSPGPGVVSSGEAVALAG